MAYINDNAFDSGLHYVSTNGARLDICTQEPVTYAEATATYTLGNSTSVTCTTAANGAVDGRAVTIAAISTGTVSGTSSASHWAYTDGVSLLLATGPLASAQAVSSGNTFTLDSIALTIRDATT